MGARRYSDDEMGWLVDEITKAMGNGSETVAQAVAKVGNDFRTLTGRDIKDGQVAQLYWRERARRRARVEDAGVELRENQVVVVLNKNSGIAKIHPELNGAVASIHGQINDHEFYVAKRVHVQFKTVIEVKEV